MTDMPRGGQRPGAGRKAGPNGAKVMISCRIDQCTKQIIERWQEKGYTVGSLIDMAIATIDEERVSQ